MSAPVESGGWSASRSRNVAIIAFATVALAGVLSGAALDRYVLFLWSRPPLGGNDAGGRPRSDFGPPRGRGGPYGRGSFGRGDFGRGGPDFLFRELDLSSTQRQAIDSLMERQAEKLRTARERIRPQMDSVLAETEREVEKRLTPKQTTKYRELRATRPQPGERGPPPRP